MQAVKNDNWKTYIILIIICMTWAATFVCGKLVTKEIPPFTASFWRFLMALLVLVPLTLRSKEKFALKKLKKMDYFIIVILALTGFLLYNYMFITGLKYIEAGRGSVIVAMNPTLIYLGAVIFFKERFSFLGLLGLIFAFLGASVVISRGDLAFIAHGSIGFGELVFFGCAASWAIYSLLGRLILMRISPLTVTTLAAIAAFIISFPLSLTEGSFFRFLDFSLTLWISLIILGFFGTAVCFTLFYRSMLKIGMHKAAIFINLVPVFTIVYGYIFFKEEINTSLFLGFILIITGVSLIQKAR